VTLKKPLRLEIPTRSSTPASVNVKKAEASTHGAVSRILKDDE
jgi:hypothetical protein